MSFVLMAVLLAADPRPTASDVRAAVEISRTRFAEKNLAPSVNRLAEASLRRRQAAVEKTLAETLQIADPMARQATVKKAVDELQKVQFELADVHERMRDEVASTELDAIDLSRLTATGVGRLECHPGLSRFRVRCERILGPEKSVLIISDYGPVAARGGLRGGVPKVQATVVLKGIATESMQAGKEIADLAVNVIAVDREMVQSGGNVSRPVRVFEAFDPDRPFQ